LSFHFWTSPARSSDWIDKERSAKPVHPCLCLPECMETRNNGSRGGCICTVTPLPHSFMQQMAWGWCYTSSYPLLIAILFRWAKTQRNGQCSTSLLANKRQGPMRKCPGCSGRMKGSWKGTETMAQPPCSAPIPRIACLADSS